MLSLLAATVIAAGQTFTCTPTRVWDGEGHVRELLTGNDSLARIILPLLDAWRDIRKHAANLDRQLLVAARNSRAAQLLMTIPGIGAITSLSFSAAIEDPGTHLMGKLVRRLAHRRPFLSGVRASGNPGAVQPNCLPNAGRAIVWHHRKLRARKNVYLPDD